MCGIIGFIDKNSKLTNEEKILIARKMLGLIEYRGRDGSDIYIRENVVMGHNRLSIMDISNIANQPFYSSDRNLIITFNGEIFNHIELRGVIDNKKYVSSSDTETFLNLYYEKKEKCFSMIRGMFSVAFHDVLNDQIVLGNDYYGIKPLYYIDTPDFFAWSSEIKTFRCLPNIDFIVNHSRLMEYGLFRTTVGPETLFLGIKRVMPSEIIYYNITQKSTDVKKFDFGINNSARNLDNCLKLSVDEHLLSDVPVGLQLSGGLDSSLISALAVKASNQKEVHSFSIGLPDPKWNEFEYSRVVSKQLRNVHHEITFSQVDFCELFPKATYHLDEPVNYPNTIPIMILAKEAKKNVSILLSGEGADEIFGGYTRYKKIYQNDLNDNDLVLSNSFNQYDDLKNVFNLNLSLNINNRYSIIVDIANFDTCRKLSEYDIKTFLPSLLLRQDKMGMAYNLENRFPFLDPRIVSFGLNLLPREKFNSSDTKILLKKTAKQYLPEEIVNRKKCGFGLPISDWLKDESGFGKYLNMFTSPKIKRHFFDYDNITRYIREHLSEQRDNSELLWMLISLEVWMRIFIDKNNPSEIWLTL